MLEYIPISFNRNSVNFITSQKYIIKENTAILEQLNLESKRLKFTPSNELFDMKPAKPLRQDKKKIKADRKRKRIEFCYFKNTDLKIEPAELFINIERKKMTERSPDLEKKPLPRSSLKDCSPFRTFYSKKRASAVVSSNGSPQASHVFMPRQINTYENWKINNNISVNSKVFIIIGTYPDVRRALLQRGWIENEDQESIYFDLKWARNARVPSNMFDWQSYNHFPRNFELSVKWQLYENIKLTNKVTKANWLNFMPRSFKLDAKGTEEFFNVFKAVYAVSILKEFIEAPAKFLVEQVIIANIVCKRWMQDLENSNEQRSEMVVMNVEWRILISKDPTEIKSSFQRMMLNTNQDVYSVASSNLEKIAEMDPQYLLNGIKNIWIIKAGRKSRGRDISLFNDLNRFKLLTTNSNFWVVQKYIENPLIISNRKFDIRQWVLISSSDPLTIWIYQKSYLRFSLENYDDENITNPYIHLTNNSISKKSQKFYSSDIKGCMWSIEQFQDYLLKEHKNNFWTSRIFPGIKKIVKYSLLAVGNLGRKNSFEILGYDFMIDQDFNPWLLEINSSPAMDYSTNVTEVLVKEVLEDAVKVVVDFANGESDTGSFEMCYKAKSYIPFRKTGTF